MSPARPPEESSSSPLGGPRVERIKKKGLREEEEEEEDGSLVDASDLEQTLIEPQPLRHPAMLPC